MCQSVNLSWKIVVQNAGCVFAYFCDGYKDSLQKDKIDKCQISGKMWDKKI